MSEGAETHRLRRMNGRDPSESHRTATPLELLYDLTLVVAFSLAGSQLAHALTTGHVLAGLLGFAVAMFAITLAWINFSWFASAYDTDDAFMRLATLLQMVGVLLLALGLPDLFEGFNHGEFDNAVVVAGYVTMRISMILLWARAAAHDPERRSTCLAYVELIAVAQVGWVVTATDVLPVPVQLALALALFALEVGGLVWIETHFPPTPWHPHHIAERYGLLAIISLGEVVLGTTTAIEAVVDTEGWSLEPVLIALSGVSLAVGMWWSYFVVPFGDALSHSDRRSMIFGFGHLVLYASITATGAGLHAAAYFAEHHTELDASQTVLTVVIPLAVFVLALYALFHLLLPGHDPLHVWLVLTTLLVLGAAYALAAAGVSLSVALVVLMLAPWITVVGYEARGYRHLRTVDPSH
ncbi:low temperature requirement protein LtrA [Nocardioides sp. BE266]|uniref:low temperature requirement protein A n=1 Tax=Nocardioides sp. BE266 TaxID=2817725 RepID=UPI002859D648|nr:low temperature requirement protein A [Nocardioides sp. BE266]MDR7251117.1 low temperature requirement protein LtrA [Nocardioides sp. BE266]